MSHLLVIIISSANKNHLFQLLLQPSGIFNLHNSLFYYKTHHKFLKQIAIKTSFFLGNHKKVNFLMSRGVRPASPAYVLGKRFQEEAEIIVVLC